MDKRLVDLAITEVPGLIELIREQFVKAAPDLPVPTNEQVIAAYKSAFASSLAVDERYLAIHPPGGAVGQTT